jgi:hypothetical protein
MNPNTCPPVIREKGAMFAPFSPRILAHALKNFRRETQGNWIYKNEVYQQLGYVLSGNIATIPPKPFPSFLFGKR